MKTAIFAALALTASGLALAACSGGADQAQEAEAADGIPGLTATNARLVLPAVEGNPGAVYFDLAYDGERNIAVRSAEVEGAARAEMHEMAEWNFEQVMGEMGPMTMQPGDKASFEPGGRHVMAFELSPELQAGGTTEVTLIIAGGDETSFPAEIVGAGEDR